MLFTAASAFNSSAATTNCIIRTIINKNNRNWYYKNIFRGCCRSTSNTSGIILATTTTSSKIILSQRQARHQPSRRRVLVQPPVVFLLLSSSPSLIIRKQHNTTMLTNTTPDIASNSKNDDAVVAKMNNDIRSKGADDKNNDKDKNINNNKRKNYNNNNNKNNKYNNNNKKRKWGNKKNNNKNNEEDGNKDNDKRPKTNWNDNTQSSQKNAPHEGSFAHSNMRKLLNVQLDGFNDNDEKEESGNDANTKMETTTDANTEVKENTASAATTVAAATTMDAADTDISGNNNDNKLTAEETTTTSKSTVKRKIAILLGYNGKEYNGFQINPSSKTVQAYIEKALYENGNLAKSNFGYPKKYSWSTSGRTDKGVHASGQTVSCKIEIPSSTTNNGNTSSKTPITNEKQQVQIQQGKEQDILNKEVSKINAFLPDDIRILDIKRVVKGFCAKTQRDKVIYTYMIPSYVFMDRKELRKNVFEKVLPNNNIIKGCDGGEDNFSDPLSNDDLSKLHKELKTYRITDDKKQLLQQTLQLYVGTKSYHNFTKGMALPKKGDKQNERYIMNFDVIKTDVYGDPEDTGTEWITTQVIGQSFLYNQIRKMICLAIDVVRGATKPLIGMSNANYNDVNYYGTTIKTSVNDSNNAFLPTKTPISSSSPPPPPSPLLLPAVSSSKFMNFVLRKENPNLCRISIAPAEGLFLDLNLFDSYNKRHCKDNRNGYLDWNSKEAEEKYNTDAVQQYKKFREDIIVKQIVEDETRKGNFIKHLFIQEYIWNFQHYYDINNSIIKEEEQEEQQQEQVQKEQGEKQEQEQEEKKEENIDDTEEDKKKPAGAKDGE